MFRNLYLILKFIDNQDSNNILDKKFYTNLLRSYLPSEFIQILAIHCYVLEDEKNQKYETYKRYLEIFSFLEHISIVNKEREIVVPILYIFDYYDLEAFDKNIWVSSNSLIKEVYKKNTKNECTPYLNHFINQEIYSKDNKNKFSIQYNGDLNCYEFDFSSELYSDYSTFKIIGYLDGNNRLVFDDHIIAFIELKCNKSLSYLYMQITYSKDFSPGNINYSQMELNIYRKDKVLKIDVSRNNYTKDLEI